MVLVQIQALELTSSTFGAQQLAQVYQRVQRIVLDLDSVVPQSDWIQSVRPERITGKSYITPEGDLLETIRFPYGSSILSGKERRLVRLFLSPDGDERKNAVRKLSTATTHSLAERYLRHRGILKYR